MAVNGLIIDISPLGITVGGAPFGATRPNLGLLLTEKSGDLRIYVRQAIITTPVSASGHNTFTSPVSFGSDICIISINGVTYIPSVDYKINGHTVTWKDTNKTIHPEDEVVLFGPANDYTANAFTIEVLDMQNELVFNDGDQTIRLTANGLGDNFFPFKEDAIYIVKNGSTYAPGTSFTYDPLTSLITWSDTTDLTVDDLVFVYYYNLYPTSPFRLGEALIRFQQPVTVVDDLPPNSFNLGSTVSEILANASNVFLNTLREVDLENYQLIYPSIVWRNGVLALKDGDELDVSFFRDVTKRFSFFNDALPGNGWTFTDPNYRKTPSHMSISDRRGFLWKNGLLMVGESYDAVDNNAALHTPSVNGPQYTITSNVLTWLTSSGTRGSDPIESDDKIEWTGFTDLQSNLYLKNEYFSGWDGNSSTKVVTQNVVDADKVVLFLNGVAHFSQFGEIAAGSTGNRTITITDSADADSDGFVSDIIVVYFTDIPYAGLWTFDPLQTPGGSSILPTFAATWNNGVSVPLNTPIPDPNNVLLFVNGIRQDPQSFSIDVTGTVITNISMGALDGPAAVDPNFPDAIMLLYI